MELDKVPSGELAEGKQGGISCQEALALRAEKNEESMGIKS